MRSYLASLILGVAVGIGYGLVKVLGMLAGEQAVSLVRSHVFKSGLQLSASGDRGEASMADDVRGIEGN